MLRTLSEKVDPKHTALVVIDMQNDFCHENGAVAQDGGNVTPAQEMVPRLQALIDSAHEAGAHVVFTQAWHSEWTDSEVRMERRVDKSPTCMEGTWGAEFYGVFPEERDLVLKKNRFSAFIGTNLDLILRTRGIKSLILTGTVTNVCVESTAREGFMHDYYIVVVEDGVAAGNRAAHEASLRAIDGTFGVLASTKDVLQAWASAPKAAATGR